MANMTELDDNNIMEVIEKEPLVFIDFYASWCGSCRVSAPMFGKVAEEEGVKIFKIDVEKNPKIKEMITLPGLPSVGCFKNGEPQDLVNVTKEEPFRDFIKKMKGLKMDIKTIKDLAQKYTFDELQKFADEFEHTGVAPVKTHDDPGDQMSDYLMGAELRFLMDQGMPLNEAVREFSKRVRGVLT